MCVTLSQIGSVLAPVYKRCHPGVDRLTKMVHLVPCTESTSAAEFAQLFVEHVVKLHGVPESVVSDRGPQFNNKSWAKVCETLRMQRAMSSAYHPESDGQTERTNRIIEEMLRAYVCPDQRDWDRLLWCVEFAINNAHQESVKNTFLPELWAAPINAYVR